MKHRTGAGTLRWLLCLTLMLGLMLALGASALAASAISYLDENGVSQDCTSFNRVTSSTTTWKSGWYVVDDNVTVGSRITVEGAAHLILCDRATLNVNACITVEGDNSLSIYAQSTGNSMGSLIVTKPSDGYYYAAAIGGDAELLGAGGYINIYGGTVVADASNSDGCAGIGGGWAANNCRGANVTICSGNVTAIGGTAAAGIGYSADYQDNESCTITINGGTVTATGGDSYVEDGTVIYHHGAGIGGGSIAYESNDASLNRGNIVIGNGVTVYAGSSPDPTTNVTSTFAGNHKQQYVRTEGGSVASTYSVTITAGEHMTKTTDSGEAQQTGLTGEMTDVVYTADEGYYFPTDYSVAEVNGISVTRDSDTQIMVSGRPTADADITLTAPTARPASSHSVTITQASYMTKTTDSGEAQQTGLTGAMAPVVYTARSSYYFPTDYSVEAVNGISVTRDSYTQITVSGTPTADTEITLTAPTKKTKPDAPTTVSAVDCTTTDNNDGKLIGVTTDMEYQKNGSWIAGTGSVIEGLVPGTYNVRYKATDTTSASSNQRLTIAALEKRIWYVGDKINLSGKSIVPLDYTGWSSGVANVEYTVPNPEKYDKTAEGWSFKVWSDGSSDRKLIITIIPEGKTVSDVPIGFKIKSGDGTTDNPYWFDLVYDIEPTAAYSVTITPGSNMTKTVDSGEAQQTGLSGAMTPVVYTANEGYYFPTNYSVAVVNRIYVARDSYTQITVAGTPSADTQIRLTAPTAKTKPDAPTTAAAVNCTTADSNDGKLTGVTTAMEYKKSDADNWTDVTGNDITGLAPGTYYVRYKATDTALASDNQELTIKILQTITAEDVTANYGETGKSIVATTDGDGALSYAVKSGDAVTVDSSTGALTIAKVGTAVITVTAAETQTYAQTTKDINVTVGKANPTANAPTGLTATYGQTLADVSLEGKNPEGNTPGTWAWADAETTSVGDVGTNTFKANFTPTDTANYNSVENVDVTVKVKLGEPRIAGYDLVLDGVLGLRCYVEVPEDFNGTGAAMTFSMPYRENQVIPYGSAATDTATGFQVFTCNVYAYQMADEISVSFAYQKDGETKYVTHTYSVKEYLDKVEADTSSEETLALVNATRNYGHYVQPYLYRLGTGVYQTVMPAGTGTPDINAAKTGSAAKAVQSTGAYLDSSYFSGAIIRLNVNTGTDLVFELKPVAGFAEQLTATVDDGTSYPVTLNDRGVYRIAKQTIAANNLEVESSFNVKHDTENVFTITASPMNYISLVLNQSTAEDECNALAALYEYWAAADGYNHPGA